MMGVVFPIYGRNGLITRAELAFAICRVFQEFIQVCAHNEGVELLLTMDIVLESPPHAKQGTTMAHWP